MNPHLRSRDIPAWFSEVYKSDGYDTDALALIARIPLPDANDGVGRDEEPAKTEDDPHTRDCASDDELDDEEVSQSLHLDDICQLGQDELEESQELTPGATETVITRHVTFDASLGTMCDPKTRRTENHAGQSSRSPMLLK
ncbi:hypothetical protein KRP22_002101 [Phytophthora ramorum]|nr:hypothetical protein KRP22_1384 [Phytophthora ramorum]